MNDIYITEIFNTFLVPGLMGGLIIGFSVYFFSFGISKALDLINTFGNYEVYEND